ncbi:hypothetical protein P154DRAFT_607945 [Amniculicola lignicola CBS 123094]|uniref:Uncharacterized protein n=1 Tax=Amniculicola lignicola CBS 123094 TaxID=1392246 RepID=A0A6A5W6R2_9PLEO|nr:hypothetical protein P154DRAFT_607945 [Amniculicola lignicola CBS 123094]
MNLITWIWRQFLYESKLTANMSVKIGLVAAAAISPWCYATTILDSVRLTYVCGFAGFCWFVAGATVKILLYTFMAIELKRRAPRANTIPEALRVRFGIKAYLAFFTYGVAVQILTTTALLHGGPAALNFTTGTNTIVMNYLFPLGMVIYMYSGGSTSTFISNYLQVRAFESLPVLKPPGKLWDLLQPDAVQTSAYGAKDGSYLTMQSGEGLILGVVIIVSGFGSVFVGPAYGQKAIAGEPNVVINGYVFGVLAWFSIPLRLCATMSFVAIAPANTEYWPVSAGITPYQINNALILPLTAQAVMGKDGAAAVILMVFVAVTSLFSAEIIAHASFVTFDIYQPYINPAADDKGLKLVSRIALAFSAIFSASFSTALNASSVSMAVIPIALAVNSAHVSPTYILARNNQGLLRRINVLTTFENWPMFAGCTVGLFAPLSQWVAMRPFTERLNWDRLFLMQAVQPRLGEPTYSHEDESDLADCDPAGLARSSRNAKIACVVMCLIFLVIIPFSLCGSESIFSGGFFTGWTVIVFIWCWCATLPIWCVSKRCNLSRQ